MAHRAQTITFLGLLALLAAGGTWYLVRDTANDPGLAPAAGPATPGAPAESVGDAPRQLEPGPEHEGERLAAEATGAVASGLENFDTERAILVDVTVVRPPDTPADEVLELIAFSSIREDGGEFDLEGEGLALQLQRFSVPVAKMIRRGVTDPSEGREFCVRPIVGDSVRVPFHPGADHGLLILSGRYLYLEKAARIDLAAGARAITLEPLLGARIHGELRAPATATGRGLGPDSITARVHLGGMDIGGRRAGQARQLRAECDVDGSQGAPEYAFDALPADMTYFLVVDPDRFEADRRMGVPLRAGRSTRVDFDLELGVRVTGRVTDGEGAPIAGAALYQIGLPATIFTRKSLPRTESGDEGRFVLDGLESGKVRIRAWKEGWLAYDHAAIEAEGGSEHDVGDLALEAGESLAGTVRWPDGRAAGGAQVQVLKTMEGAGRQTLQATTADVDGAFAFAGLLEGPYTVVAALGPDGATEGAGVWRASVERANGVQAPVALVLVLPLGIAGLVRDDLGNPVTKFRVVAEHAGENAWGGYAEVAREFESEDGSFFLTGVFAGPHDVFVSAPGHAAGEDGTRCAVPQAGDPLEIVLARTGEVHGVVIDPSGRPIRGAAVYARLGPDEPMMGWGGGADTVSSNERGEFRLTGLAPGGHAVAAGHAEWADSTELPLRIEPGERVLGITLQLRVGGTIAGEVLDAEGFAMQGRQVSYSKTMLMGFGSGLEAMPSDAAGAFRFEHVSPGEWTVSAGPGFDEQMEALREADENTMMELMSRTLTEKVTVVDGEEVYVRFGSAPRIPVRLYGRITRGGAPVRTKLYAVVEGGALLSGLKVCDSSDGGDYEVVLDRPGPYVLGVEATAGTVEFALDVPEAEAHEFHIELPSGAMHGTVFGPDGAPAAEVRVSLFEESGAARLTRLDGNTRRTDAEGTFAFQDLRAGVYVLRAGVEGDSDRDGEPAYGSIVSTPYDLGEDENRTGIELHLANAGRVEGIVRDANGAPVAEAGVYVRNERGDLLSPFPRATTDPLGRFTYRGIAPGAVTVSARMKSQAAADSEPIHVRAGEASEVELTLEPATLLVITVQDAGGADVRAAISVTDSAGREMSGMLSPDFFEDAVAEGISTRELRVGPVPAGRYTALATAADGTSRKKRVTVRGKAETRVRIKLKE